MYSLHPITTDLVCDFLHAISEADESPIVARARQGMTWMEAGDSRGPDLVSHSLAAYLAERTPTFAMPDVSLSMWEASIDRGIGMLMRPPSRIFVDAGMARSLAQSFPIRLDAQRGTMAGAYVPAALIPQLHDLLNDRLERQLRRLQEAEIEPVVTLASMLQAVESARNHETGLLEAMDVIHPGVNAIQIVQLTRRKDIDPALRNNLEALMKPAKKPGLISRLVRRSGAESQTTTDTPDL